MKRALVTGANRGLGLEVSRQLHARGYVVWMAGRDAAATEAAATSVGERAHALHLDVTDETSRARLVEVLKAEPPLDALVNNAGASFRGLDAEIARNTLATNTWGPVALADALRDHLSPAANVVMVSSGMGELSSFSADLRRQLLAPELQRADLSTIAERFIAAIADGTARQAGFPNNAYSVSKALLNAATRLLAAEWRGSGPKVNAVCPGWVRTRMGGGSAPRAVAEGASGIVWAATLGVEGPSGGFFRDGRPIPW